MKLTLFSRGLGVVEKDALEAVDAALGVEGESVVVESAPSEAVPLGFRYLYAVPVLGTDGIPVCAGKARTLVCIGMNPNTAGMPNERKDEFKRDDPTVADLRRIAGNLLTAPAGAPFTRVVFLNMAPFRGVRGPNLGVRDSLTDLDLYRAEHEANCEIVPLVLERILADEGELDVVAMWGDIRDKANGRFALAGVRDLGGAFEALGVQSNVRWYCFGRTSFGSPRNYAGLRYTRGMSAAQKRLRAGTLSADDLAAAASPSSWLSLAAPEALIDVGALASIFALPRGLSRAD